VQNYLDHNATTPLSEVVLAAMQPYLQGCFGNPSSVHHYGRRTRAGLDQARERIARLVGVQASQVIFTSGGTEANNLALKGVAAGQQAGHLIVGATEHASVIESARALAQSGWVVDTLPVTRDGAVCLDTLPALLRPDTRLVSLMLANNETGVITDVATVRKLLPDSVILHTDAVQALGKMPVDFATTGAGMMSLSAHKINGPGGAGALIVDKRLMLTPLLHGGGQEGGRRAGTENIAAAVGFGKGAELLGRQEIDLQTTLLEMRQRLVQRLLAEIPEVVIFGANQPRLANTLFFAVPMLDGEALVMAMDDEGFAIASGSACSSSDHQPSHVLLAMGVDENLARCAIRVSLGYGNDWQVIDRFIDRLKFQVQKLNKMAALAW